MHAHPGTLTGLHLKSPSLTSSSSCLIRILAWATYSLLPAAPATDLTDPGAELLMHAHPGIWTSMLLPHPPPLTSSSAPSLTSSSSCLITICT